LKDPCYCAKLMSIFSDTEDAKFHSFALHDKVNNTKYSVNMIDTPGLHESKAIGEQKRDDEMIMKAINACLKLEITKINTLLIFISFELGVTQDDLECFKVFLDKFGHDNISIVMAITRAEDKAVGWKSSIENELKAHPYFSAILKKGNIKIKFIGCVVNPIEYSNKRDLQLKYSKVYKMREELLAAIFESESQVQLIDLPIANTTKNGILQIFTEQNEILDYLSNINDFEIGEVRLKITKFALNIDKLGELQGYLVSDNMNQHWAKLRDRMSVLLTTKPDMPAEVKAEFIGKVVLGNTAA